MLFKNLADLIGRVLRLLWLRRVTCRRLRLGLSLVGLRLRLRVGREYTPKPVQRRRPASGAPCALATSAARTRVNLLRLFCVQCVVVFNGRPRAAVVTITPSMRFNFAARGMVPAGGIR